MSKRFKPVPIETVQEGDTIAVTRDHKDTRLVITGTVEHITADGNTRIIDSGEGVELARYTIGQCHGLFVQLVEPAKTADRPLELLAV